MFSRYDRLNTHFNKRLLWCNYTHQDVVKKYYDRFSKFNQQTEITVYRGFRVRKGEAVRKGVTKLDNPDALIP